MSRLFILRRPGILVVSGWVLSVNGDTVVIQNDVYLPVSQKTAQRRCALTFEPGKLTNMGLQPGMFILASTSDDFRVEMMLEGGEVPDEEFALQGYQVRFNGSFDFPPHGTEKEQHVFAGNVLSSENGTTRDGKAWTRVTVGWKRKGQPETRTVVYWSSTGETLPECAGKRVIFATGEQREAKGTQYYNAFLYAI